MSFVHLHVHDQYSVLDGFGTAKQYIAEATRLKMPGLALTNHGNVDGAIEFQKECEKAGIQSIIGCEMFIVKDLNDKTPGENRYHMNLIVENQTGWNNLLNLLTIANTKGFYWRPRVDIETFMKYCEGFIVLTACSQSFVHMKEGENILHEIRKKLGKDHVYLELMPHKYEDQEETNRYLLELAEDQNYNIVATNDCHYIEKDQALVQEMLLAIQSKKTWNDEKRWRFICTGLYLRSEREMIKAFKDQNILTDDEIEVAIANTGKIADLCKGFKIEKLPVELPSVIKLDKSEDDFLFDLVEKGFKVIAEDLNREQRRQYRERINHEMETITSMKFTRYFLIVWELIDWCKKNDIMTGPGRGSVGGSLVAYLLGITNVDPIKYNLLFSRFHAPGRIDLPDIDMDFEDIKRDKVRKHLEELYGVTNVASLSTFGTMQAKAAIRDVARVLEIPLKSIEPILNEVDNFTEDKKLGLVMATKAGALFTKTYSFASEMMIALEGQIRQAGIHAAAVCISNDSLDSGKRCNLVKRNDVFVANWDKEYSEYVGLMKLDVLGLSALTILSETKRLIKQNCDDEIEFKDIDLTDPKPYKVLRNGWTAGVFQLGGSPSLTRFCRDLQIDEFETIVHATSLWRPGPLRSGMAEEFRQRKNGKKFNHINPIMEEITDTTYGIIMYQEQIMLVMNRLAGMSWAECDKVRKVIGKSKGDAEFEKFRDKFMNGCRASDISGITRITTKDAEEIWNEMATFGGYGFNRSHAVEYSMITYWDLWCKAYYPAEFFAASLTYGGDNKKELLIEEAIDMGMSVKLPQLEFSDALNWSTDKEGETLYAPFIEIKGVGEKTAKKLAEHKNKKQTGFFKTKDASGINANIMKILTDIQLYESGKMEKRLSGKFRELFSFKI